MFRKTTELRKKYDAFLTGNDGASLEETLIKKIKKLEELERTDKVRKKSIERIERKLSGTYQKAGMVKYDAFQEMGGKMSFALALLNENDDGFVINSIHSREGCYTYIKEIIHAQAYNLLTDEEKKAINEAIKKNKEFLLESEQVVEMLNSETCLLYTSRCV